MNKRRLLLFVPLLIALLLGFFLWKGLYLDPKKLPSALIDKPFPEFALPALADAGQTLTVADVTGEVALVNVWATWCPACRVEHPQLVNIARREGIPIYGINYKDDRAQAEIWLRQLGNPYVFNIFDKEGRLGLDLGVYGAPETYIIDAKGVIRYRHAGPVDMAIWKKMRALIEQIRAEA
ncbi:DsbE family thiol:disulfide interchange protein [Motiliproteus sp. SC1-56]|uniref:DsbE family thiol:disulfide interchange protein n=1 Tax=Motiliproteus sp. SC1-56 TaxID=2799565 RepID=UPI001A8F38FB|nr:DsbE family thiol:disulfide interchange protein [Motiliproteus sp. SC1-56]